LALIYLGTYLHYLVKCSNVASRGLHSAKHLWVCKLSPGAGEGLGKFLRLDVRLEIIPKAV
jgi:hypothetical protein